VRWVKIVYLTVARPTQIKLLARRTLVAMVVRDRLTRRALMDLVLVLFDILPPVDPISGEVRVPAAEFTSGFTSHPKPYECRISPRSEIHAALLRTAL